jgi:hypothetical protein
MSTSVTLMATRGHCRKCQLISNEGVSTGGLCWRSV